VRTYTCTLHLRKYVFGYLPWMSSNCTMQQTGGGFRGGAPCAHTSAHYISENVFLGTCHGCLQTAQCNKWEGGSGVALRDIPLHTTSQKICFWVPAMDVFKLHNATNGWGVQGWRSVCTYLCTLHLRKCVFGYLPWVSSNCTMQQMGGWFRGGTPSAHTLAHYNPKNEGRVSDPQI